MRLSACIEWLFADETPDFAERVRACHSAGIEAIEFHLWRDKNIEALRDALQETGVELIALVNDPRRHLVKRETHEEFLVDFAASLRIAERLGSRAVLATIGPADPARSRAEQRAAVVAAFTGAACLAEKAGKIVLIEALNSIVDHPGFFLTSTTEALDIAEAVGSSNIRVLYDVYHSAMMGEDLRTVLAGRMHLVAHVQVADVPGRHEPGTGAIDWPTQLGILNELGYRGAIGLEYKPATSTRESLAALRVAFKQTG
ncbi:MAG: TIM barrel protein [Pseudomonadota bacterium]